MSSESFLQLPREIRDRVYDFVFPGEAVLPVTISRKRRFLKPGPPCWKDFSNAEEKTPDEILALFYVNHQISAEAKVCFYGRHTITGQPSDLLCFIQGIGLCRDLIRNIEIHEACVFREFTYRRLMPQLLGKLSTLLHLRSVMVRMSETDFQSAQSRITEFGFGQLDQQVEITIHSFCMRHIFFDDGGALKHHSTSYVTVITWTQAEGSLEWKEVRREKPLDG